MEHIHIKEKNINTIICLDDKKYYGHKYVDNHIENIENLNILKPFLLSNDYTKLPRYQKYEVYLDNQTGLKHYFYNAIENFYLLFSNNGVYAINYLSNNNRLTDTKIFNFRNKIIICTILGLTLAMGNMNKPATKIGTSVNLLINDYKPSDIELMINSSSNLTEEEKKYLYNESFITDVLSIINNSYYEKNKMAECFHNISIIGFNDKEHESQAGYYRVDTPSILYVKDYAELNEKNKPTIAHEFAHLCQDIGRYNLITEASADIITKEYFFKDYKFGYSIQVKLLKKLMEIIGSYPIWYYNFTGDFSKIETIVLPYFTSEEYQKFLSDLSFEHDNNQINEPKYKELDDLLNTLYYRIYNKNIKKNEIINLIEKEDQTLVRYYFNQRMINEENSYYLDYNLGTCETISFQEAIDRGIISAHTISYTKITNDEAFKIIEDNTHQLKREINYRSHHVAFQYIKYESEQTTISGTIDNVKYEDVNLDDLVKAGLIDVTYYVIHRKTLTSSDYANHNYKEDELYFINEIFIKEKYPIINEDSVEYLIPKKIPLPPINTEYQKKQEYVKKKKITYQ